jgi:hypothetical protein
VVLFLFTFPVGVPFGESANGGNRFGIELAPEVVQADGNVKNLAWRICNAKKVLVCYHLVLLLCRFFLCTSTNPANDLLRRLHTACPPAKAGIRLRMAKPMAPPVVFCD